MLTIYDKLTTVATDHRRATIAFRSDLKDHAMAREELISSDAGKRAIAEAMDRNIPDPRIANGPVVVPLNPSGNPIVDTETEKLGGFAALYDCQARLI